MAANYQLPGSLEPPDYGEMARIGALQTEVEHRALSQLRREIGLRNMQRETVASVQAGVDPILARRNALFNNARFLFADNPAALVQLQNSEEARTTRDAYQRAMLNLRALHEQNYGEAQSALSDVRRREADVREQLGAARTETERAKLEAAKQSLDERAKLHEAQKEAAQARLELSQSREDRIAKAQEEAAKFQREQDATKYEEARARLFAQLSNAQVKDPQAEVDRLLPPRTTSPGWQQIGKYRFRIPGAK